MNLNDAGMYNSYPGLAIRMHRTRMYDPDMSGIIYIAAGMGYNPMDKTHKAFLDEKYMETPGYEQAVYDTWLKHKDEVTKHIDTLPTHYEFLKKYIHKE